MTQDTITIPLTKGLVTIIDAADWPLVEGFRWHAAESKRGGHVYALAHRPGGASRARMHRLIMGLEGRGLVVDHIDGDSLNNRRFNLRIATMQQNAWNNRGERGRALRGAYPSKWGRWEARIKDGARNLYLGTFDTEQEAHAAYLVRAAELHGEWNPLVVAPFSRTPETA